MKIDLQTDSLFTDSGQFLKKLHCPLRKSWNALKPLGSAARMCDSCSRVVHDTASMSDNDLLALLALDPGACLKVSIPQENCTVIPNTGQHGPTESPGISPGG
jgi:hypothetical protein